MSDLLKLARVLRKIGRKKTAGLSFPHTTGIPSRLRRSPGGGAAPEEKPAGKGRAARLKSLALLSRQQ